MVVGKAGNKNKISSEDNGQKGLIPASLNDNSKLATVVVSGDQQGRRNTVAQEEKSANSRLSKKSLVSSSSLFQID